MCGVAIHPEYNNIDIVYWLRKVPKSMALIRRRRTVGREGVRENGIDIYNVYYHINQHQMNIYIYQDMIIKLIYKVKKWAMC